MNSFTTIDFSEIEKVFDSFLSRKLANWQLRKITNEESLATLLFCNITTLQNNNITN